MTIYITSHAIERYVERINPNLTMDQAEAAIRAHMPVIERAAMFGCSVIRLGDGTKLILGDGAVVTVYDRVGRNRYGAGRVSLTGGHSRRRPPTIRTNRERGR